jgi:hypothetical protein
MFQSHGIVTRVFLVDRSRAVADIGEVRDSVRRLASSGAIVVAFDTSAVRMSNFDSVQTSTARGSLSSALAGGIRAAVTTSADADSAELVLVSPLAREELDNATMPLRATWPGRIRVVPVRGASFVTAPVRVDMGVNGEDAVAAGFALMGGTSTGAIARLVRVRVSPTDSAWARVAGHVLIHWPAADSATDWRRRQTIDAIGGVNFDGAVMVARFPRLWVLTGQTIARWSDGEPAIVEHATGEGCVRDVGILIDDASDLTLRQSFRRFAARLLAPCGGRRDLESIDPGTRTALAGTGSLAPAVALRDPAAESSRWSPWLFGLGALLLVGELAMRRARPA